MTRFEGVVARIAAAIVGDRSSRSGSVTRKTAMALCALAIPALAGCTTDQTVTGSISPDNSKVASADVGAKQKQCLVRAMYFESNRSSTDGMLAVGTVVMNRVSSPAFPDTICGVVGQNKQFAPGVMTRRMNSPALPKIEAVADEVLEGKRHPKVGHAMFFHTAGLHFPYHNMHYVAVAGGNAFYIKTGRYAPYQQPIVVADASESSIMTEAVQSAMSAQAAKPSDLLAYASQSSPAQAPSVATQTAALSPRMTASSSSARTARVASIAAVPAEQPVAARFAAADVPVPDQRPNDGGLPGVSNAYALPSMTDMRVNQAFASVTN